MALADLTTALAAVDAALAAWTVTQGQPVQLSGPNGSATFHSLKDLREHRDWLKAQIAKEAGGFEKHSRWVL